MFLSIGKFKKAVQYLEQCSRDIQTASRDELYDMPIDKNILQIIIEYIENQESSYYEELKEKTYESIMQKYYS
jgi:DNA polymerase/3'-5' exonuclease PolX